MTEREWLGCQTTEPMLEYLRGNVLDRKMRFFVCACCRRAWHLIPEAGQRAVEATENFADGLIERHELSRLADEAYRIARTPAIHNVDAIRVAALGAWCATSASSHSETTWSSSDYASLAVAFETRSSRYRSLQAKEKTVQCRLLRHIVGNPFRPYSAPEHWPPTVVHLARALHHGEDCGPVLHDALIEAGHAELAEHFEQERHHPKGCWVADLILGKG